MSEIKKLRAELEWRELMRDAERCAPSPVNRALLVWVRLPWWKRTLEWMRG